MKPAFYLRLPSDFDPARPAPWEWFDARDASAGQAPLAAIAEQAAGARVTLIAPADAVLLLQAEIPGANRQRLIKAAPYALEEQLAADVESLHFAFAANSGGGRAAAAVVARERMQQWRQGLEGAGITLYSMVPASLAIPLEPQEWSLLIDQRFATLRTGPSSALTLQVSELKTLLALTLSRADAGPRPQRLRVFSTPDAADAGDTPQQCCREAQIDFVQEPAQDALALYRRGLAQGPSIELLQGAFGRVDQIGRLWRPWRAAAALLGLLMLLQGGGMLYDYGRLSGEDARLTARIETLYRETFPEARNVVDPRLQMEQHLEALRQAGAEDDLGVLLGAVGPALQRAPVLELLALRYRDRTLGVELRLPDFQALDALKAAFEDLPGIRSEMLAADAEGGRVRTRLQLRRGEA